MGICRYATLDKSLFNVENKLFQLSEKSDVKYYTIVLFNVRQGCCWASEHTKSCIGGYSGWAVFVMATAEDLVVEGWSNTASQRNRPST